MSEADKDERGDEDVADATLSGAGGSDTGAGGEAEDTVGGSTLERGHDTIGASAGDTVEGAATDYSLAGDAAEAGVEAHPAATTPPPAKSSGRGAGFWAVVLLIVFLAGAAAWPILGPLLPEAVRPGGAPAVDPDTQARLIALENELAALKSRPAPDTGTALQDMQAKFAAQAAEIESLRQELNELAESPVSAGGEVDLEALQQRLDALESRIENVASAPPPAGMTDDETSDAVSALRAEIDKVAQQIAGIDDNQTALSSMTNANAELQSTVATLTSRLAALEDKAGDAASQRRHEAQVLALSQLAADLRAGGGYEDSLRTAQTLAGGDAELGEILTPLASQAATGAPTLAQLRQRFETVAPEIVRAGIADASGDWLERTTNRLASLITIRRVGEVSGDSVEAIVARAETRLGYGDLAAAVKQLETLTGAPARAADGWLEAARQRLAAQSAADKLQARIAELVGAG